MAETVAAYHAITFETQQPLIPRLSEAMLLCPGDITASREDFEVIGVFNPGAVRVGDDIVLLARVAERPLEIRAGWLGLPRWTPHGDCVVDWVRDQDVTVVDPRVVRTQPDNQLRLTSVSHLRVFLGCEGDPDHWRPGPMFLPQSATEEFGVEDPRISKIGETYWITYVAVSRAGAATALASTVDMKDFRRHGVIFCPENKDVVLFPQQIGGDFLALHRPNPHSHFSPPQIWIARSPDLIHWGRHQSVYQGGSEWEGDRVGGGAPPILIDDGWLHLYHGSQRCWTVGGVGPYSVGALLLDRTDPSRILARSVDPIMQPTAAFERDGFVPHVVFPTAIIPSGDRFKVYYGAADTSIGVVEFLQQDIRETLR